VSQEVDAGLSESVSKPVSVLVPPYPTREFHPCSSHSDSCYLAVPLGKISHQSIKTPNSQIRRKPIVLEASFHIGYWLLPIG
jgi:hypothetical protein